MNFWKRRWRVHRVHPQQISQDVSDIDPENGIITGFLYKRAGNTFRTWQRHWFQVENNQLVYLNRSKEPRIVMDLRQCTVETTFSMFRHHYCFKLVSPTKSYILAADSKGTRLAWTRAIKIVALLASTTKSYTLAADSEGTRLAQTRSIKNVALVKQPGPNNSEEWRRHSDLPATGAPDDLRESIVEIEPPCIDDLGRESSTGHLDHPCSSPSKDCFLDKYILGKELGKGGFGTVTAGICKADGREMAIKKVYKQPSMDYMTFAGEAEHYPAEVALMYLVCQSPRSENIIEMLEWYDDPASYTLVLEKPSPCMDLSTYLMLGPLSEDVAQIIMVQVVRALCHCSARDVFHSDIKMENILVNPDNLKVKLIDFGCGDLIQTTPYSTYSGAWYNMPPEYLIHCEYYWGPATVWSLGILLYVILCDDLPFDFFDKVCMGYLGFRRYLSPACCQLIRRCLAKKPDNRPRLSEILNHEWFQFEEHQQLSGSGDFDRSLFIK